MVSILPSARTPWDVLGQQTGAALQSVLPQAIEKRYERERGLSAIDKLEKELAIAGGDINKIVPAVARAISMNPALERSGFADKLLSTARASTGTGALSNALGNMQAQGNAPPGMQNVPQGQQQPQVSPQQVTEPPPQTAAFPKTGQGIFLSQLIPQNVGELITPEQKANMIDNVAKAGGDVNLTRQLIDDYNQGKINFNELANANVEKQAANVQRMLGFEDQIKKRIEGFVPEGTSEAEKNIYYNMVRPVLEKEQSFSDAWQKVSADIDNFRKTNEAYVKNIPEANMIGPSADQEKRLRNSAKPIMDIDPLAYNVLEQAYLAKGHSPITPAKILKPLPENVNKTLKQAGDYKDLIYPLNFSTSEFPERMMEKNIDDANEGQQKDIAKMTPSLRKEWNEDLSILNMYADLRKKGWSLPNITTLFDDVADLFSKRQQAERAMLNENIRVPARYLDFPFEKSE